MESILERREALMAYWMARVAEAKQAGVRLAGAGVLLLKDGRLAIYATENGVRTLDVMCELDGTIWEERG